MSNYEIDERKTDIIVYGSDIPKTVEIFTIKKKISGLSDNKRDIE